MKNTLTFAILCILTLSFAISIAQNPNLDVQGGEAIVPRNSEPCLTETQRNQIQARIQTNIEQLRAAGIYQEPNTEGGHPLFIWPVAQASGHNYHAIYSLTNYLDHNTAFPNQIEDYDCGIRSYDTSSGYNHKGFDIITWPFWWKQMDLNQAINVAAADGQIMDKNDGSFDRNCSFNSNIPNYIAVQHDDGSVTWYLHMKEGELTSKGVGDNVVEGEFLGVIGSSGSSTLPHLHFEVYDDGNNLIDPSMGACNSLNNDTWWQDQKPYYDPGINAAITHSSAPVFEPCPTTETTNEENEFNSGELIRFAIYLRDQRAGTSVNMKIRRPDSSLLADWDFALVDDFQISHWIWQNTPDMDGIWTWEATYMGETAIQNFYVGVLEVDENILAKTVVYPNPFDDMLYISSEAIITDVIIRDILGRQVTHITNGIDSISEINVSSVSEGMYFATLTTDGNLQKTIKLIKE